MDWPIESTSVLILGAGFSVAATDGKLPLMRTFFDHLKAEDYPLLNDFVRWKAVDPKQANVESVLLALDQIRTSPKAVLAAWADRWSESVPEIHSQLAMYTLGRLKSGLEIADDNWAAKVLHNVSSATTVISMNYDNLAERILSNRTGLVHGNANPTCPHCKMRRLLERACSCAGRDIRLTGPDWCGAIIKPHGSIAWKRCLNPACCSFQCLVAHEQCQPFEPCVCPNCGQPCGPVLVMPTMSKNLSDTPEIGIMWQAARQAIADAGSILLFGFSMPASDELLMQMMRTAIQENRKLRQVASIDLEPVGVLDRFKQAMPEDIVLETTPLLVEPGKAPEWLL
jgi:hypothetical protein